MLIVKIFQGPGNQMFQYAYALAAAQRIGASLKLDLTWFEAHSGHRAFVLDRFEMDTPVASKDEIDHIRTRNGSNFFAYRYNLLRDALAPRHRKAVVKEDLSRFDHELMYPYRNSHIEGYFSSERFFADHQEAVRKAFTFRGGLSEPAVELADTIGLHTVAISIRRGDFLNNPLHNVCSVGYYHRAVRKMRETVPDMELLVFSDEPDWVQRNMHFEVPARPAQEVTDPMEQMRLMAQCAHHIIPNSTFSWWGAWLSGSSNVIAPDLWLTEDRQVHQQVFGHWVETAHTVPQRWNRIPARLPEEMLM